MYPNTLKVFEYIKSIRILKASEYHKKSYLHKTSLTTYYHRFLSNRVNYLPNIIFPRQIVFEL